MIMPRDSLLSRLCLQITELKTKISVASSRTTMYDGKEAAR